MGMLRLDDKKINKLFLNNRPINRIMLNDEKIWPEILESETNKIELIIDTTVMNPNGGICFELLELFDENYNKLDFTNVDVCGNTIGDTDKWNLDIVISNDETTFTINTNMGWWGYNSVVPGYIAANPNTGTSGGPYNYGYAWLPDGVAMPVITPSISYKGYRYWVSSKGIAAGKQYKLTFESTGTKPVKYVALTPGYHETITAVTYEPLCIKFRDEDVYRYTSRADFHTGENLTVNGVTYRSKWVFGTDGNTYKYFHRNMYSNSGALLGEMLLAKKYMYNNNGIDIAEIVMVPATMQDVVEKSDGRGYLIENLKLNTVINLQGYRNIACAYNWHNYSALLYDDNDELINKDMPVAVNKFTNKPVGQLSTELILVEDPVANTTNTILMSSDSSQYREGLRLGHMLSYRIGADFQYGSYLTATLGSVNTTSNVNIITDYNVKVIAIPMLELYDYTSSLFFTKLSINGTVLKEYESTDLAKLRYEQIETVQGLTYVKRYFYNIKTKEVFEAWTRAMTGDQTYKTLRDIYVIDKFLNKLKLVTLTELLTGIYPGGYYTTANEFVNYTFKMSLPSSTTGSDNRYGAIQAMQLLDINGNEVTKYKTYEFTKGTMNNYQTDSIAVFTLQNDEIAVMTTPDGSNSSSYQMGYVFTSYATPWLPGAYPVGSSTQVPRTYESTVTFAFQQEYWLLFIPFWMYQGGYYTTYASLKFVNNNDQQLKNNGDPGVAAMMTYEVKKVRGKNYFRAILANSTQAYVIWRQSYYENKMFFYREEYDDMIPATIPEIVDKNYPEGTIPGNTTSFETTVTKQSELVWWGKENYAWQTNDYMGFGNGIIWIEQDDGSIVQLDPTKIVPTGDALILRKFGTTDDDITHKVRFKDEFNNDYELSTNAGSYFNYTDTNWGVNTYERAWLMNIFTAQNSTVNATYGYLSPYPVQERQRWFKFILKSTAKIKAIAIEPYWHNKQSAGAIYANTGGFKFGDHVIHDYATSADSKAKILWEGKFIRYILFPETNDYMTVRCDHTDVGHPSYLIDSPSLLWDHTFSRFDTFTLQELIALDKVETNYNKDDGTYKTIIPVANMFQMKMAMYLNIFGDSGGAQGGIGNCLLYDQDYNLINLEHVESTPNRSDFTMLGEKQYIGTWKDEAGNRYHAKTDLFATTSNWLIDFLFTPLSTAFKTLNTVENLNKMSWLCRPFTINNVNEQPAKWGNFDIIAETRPIGAIAIGDMNQWSSGSNYIYAMTHINYVDPIDDTLKQLRAYKTKAEVYAGCLVKFNGINYNKRYVIDMNTGKLYITWWKSTK